jgi:hypothetical protein
MSISINDVRNHLTSAYGMGNVSGISRIENGDWNSIYRIRSDEDWILRLSHDRKTQAQLEFEIAIVSHLSTQLTYVPKVRTTKEGRIFTRLRGKLCSLLQFMPGDEIPETDDAIAAWEFSLQDETATMDLGAMGKFLESYSSVVTLPSLTDQTLRRLIGAQHSKLSQQPNRTECGQVRLVFMRTEEQ